MESGWERRTPLIVLEQDQISELVRPVAQGRSLSATQILAGGLSNTLYRVDFDCGEPVVVRLYTRDGKACHKELALWRLVEGRALMPEVLFAETAAKNELPPYSITRWIEGKPLGESMAGWSVDEARNGGRSIGEALAVLGDFEFETLGFFGNELEVAEPLGTVVDGFVGYIEQCLAGRAGVRLGRALTDRVLGLVRGESGLLEALECRYTLVHADFKVANLRMDPSGYALCAIMDWEFAFAGPQMFDVGMMLRDERKLPEGFIEGFCDGFSCGGGVLPPQWMQVAKFLDLTNLCGFMAGEEERPQTMEQAQALIMDTLERWETWRLR